MKLKQLTALILSLLLMTMCLFGCESNEDPNGTPNAGGDATPAPDASTPDTSTPEASTPRPTTAEEYIAVAWEKLDDSTYKQMEKKVRTLYAEESSVDEETSYTIFDGKNFKMEDMGMTYLFYDGVYYVSLGESPLGKYALTEDWQEDSLLAPSGEDQVDFTKIKFKTLGLETDEKGNTVIVGKGASEEAKAILEELFGGSAMIQLLIDYESVELRVTVDGEYRMLDQMVTMDATVGGIPAHWENTITYEYGAQYALSAPANPDAYPVADTFMDLFT